MVIHGSTHVLELIDPRTGAQTTIARGGAVADPRWSPDGNALAYLQQDHPGGHMQIFVVSAVHQPVQLTHSATDITDTAWRPDSRELAFSAPVALASHGYFDAGSNDYTATAATAPVHLWRIAARGGIAKQLTSGPWTIAPTDSAGIFSPQFAWSQDARHIVLTRVATPWSGENEYSTIWDLSVASGTLKKITGHSRLELSPSYSPDGSRLLYWYARDGNYLAFNTLRVRQAGRDTDLTAHFDVNVAGAQWMPDGRALLVCGNERTRAKAWILSLSGAAVPVNLGAINIVCDSYMSSTFDSGIAASVARTGAIAFLGTQAHHARELYYLDSPQASPRALTHFNDSTAALELGEMREVRWTARNGLNEYGVVTFPPRMTKGRRYPILVNIHGGPGDSSLQIFAWEDWPRTQLFAAHGFIVFEPNYRGSDDNGNRFALSINRDTVSGPSDDILRGLAQVRRLAQADPTRMAVCGWSYGGLLTAWLVTQHHFWRAAVAGAAVTNEIDEYALSTSNIQNRYYLGVSPYVNGGAEIYLAQSPLTYAGAVTTPTLLWATTLDPVVPIPQMYEFFHALREHGAPVRFVVFPAAGHGPADTQQTITLTELWLSWLDSYLK